MKVDQPVIRVGKGKGCSVGRIIDLIKDAALVKFPDRKAVWIYTKDLVKYEDRSGDES